ncbi:hypothetical protein OEZ60_10415 [Defluviimonas sp. WL0024]|uniref:Uncharacterized protein n=2 Tax=Albidovulum TaxID=205889 RepID=A0ABT3IYT6_9RHOB|nr:MULTISPECIES: hypothetical protein [Defluviimonas]MCU9848422.1 hypothetical protein [Defluviimonas sp. WL0024]MCW3780592.1 hypothetical protein [Defluviimonas salinarum]
MLTLSQTPGLIADTLRLVRETLGRLNAVTLAEPAPYWTDYLREDQKRGY